MPAPATRPVGVLVSCLHSLLMRWRGFREEMQSAEDAKDAEIESQAILRVLHALHVLSDSYWSPLLGVMFVNAQARFLVKRMPAQELTDDSPRA